MLVVRPVTITDDILVSSSVPESEAVWSSGATYGANAIVRGHTDATAHRLFESQQAGNLNHNPTTDTGAWWVEIGPSNRWAMFDTTISTQTEAEDEIETVTAPPGLVDTISVQAVSAASLRIVQEDDDEGVVYDETFSLVSDSGITDPYAYCFEPIERLSELTVTGLKPYAGSTVTVTLEEPGETVLCGALIPGLSRDIGGAQYGATVGIIDFTRKTRDTNGNYTVIPGAFSKRANFQVLVENTFIDQLQNLLISLRATPTLYVGSDAYAITTVYGYYRDFNVEIAYPTKSLCSIEIEGLI